MKTLVSQNKKIKNQICTLLVLVLVTLLSNPLSAQTETVSVKGIVTSEIGPLDGVNIYLKNSSTGTVSKADGKFAFREKLKIGDVIIFSYLGYVKKSLIVTKASSSLEVFMEEAPVDILSAPNSNLPYKSKRSRRRQ